MSDFKEIMDFKHGKIQMGLPFGVEELDNHWVFKRNLTVILGTAGAGKTMVSTYMALVQGIRTNKKTLIWSSENANSTLKIKLINAILGTDLRQVSDEAVKDAHGKLGEYLEFVDTTKITDIYRLMDAADKKLHAGYHAMIVDPWNSLMPNPEKSKFKSKPEYVNEALIAARAFREEKNIAFQICVHPRSDAARKRHDKDHRYADQFVRPNAVDAEFGNEFNNKADDFLIYHRYKLDLEDWNITKMWVDKIKLDLTGGKETPLEYPVNLKYDGCRFKVSDVDFLQRAINENWK